MVIAVREKTRLDTLNYDILEVIVRWLSFKDVVEVCKVCEQVLAVVANRLHHYQDHHVIFSDFLAEGSLTAKRIFQLFGKKMRSFEITQDDIGPTDNQTAFEVFCRYIDEYCFDSRRSSKLIKMVLRMDIPSTINLRCLQGISNYFDNVKTFELETINRSANSHHDRLLSLITRNGMLRTLRLRNLNITGDWFRHVFNLRELELYNTTITGREIYTFLAREPGLQKFVHTNDVANEELIDAVCAKCLTIEQIFDKPTFVRKCPNTGKEFSRIRRLIVRSDELAEHPVILREFGESR